MQHTKRNAIILTGVLAAMLVFSVGGNVYYWDKSRSLAQEKLRVEQQANDLLATQNQILDRTKEQVEITRQKNKSLAEEIGALNNLLSQVNTDLWELRIRKASSTGNLIDTRNQAEWPDLHKRLSDENNGLIRQNRQMSHELTLLQDSLQTLVNNTLTADGFRLVAFKRNNKETSKARKVERLTISLYVPKVFGLHGRQELYLSMTDLHGDGINTPLRKINISKADQESIIPVHDIRVVNFNDKKQMQPVTFSIRRTDNVKSGRYKASVYTKDKYVGSVEVQFRDSFLFF